MPRLNLRLLGPFQATLDGRPINGFESNKVRALLAYLVIESDRPHSRDELVGLLWPDQPDASARANLRQALANLRHIIGDRTAESPLLTLRLTAFNLPGSMLERCRGFHRTHHRLPDALSSPARNLSGVRPALTEGQRVVS
jgi:hypothetical protein